MHANERPTGQSGSEPGGLATVPRADTAVEELIRSLRHDLDDWTDAIADLMPFGPTVVRRSVERIVDAHVGRLRDEAEQETGWPA